MEKRPALKTFDVVGDWLQPTVETRRFDCLARAVEEALHWSKDLGSMALVDVVMNIRGNEYPLILARYRSGEEVA